MLLLRTFCSLHDWVADRSMMDAVNRMKRGPDPRDIAIQRLPIAVIAKGHQSRGTVNVSRAEIRQRRPAAEAERWDEDEDINEINLDEDAILTRHTA